MKNPSNVPNPQEQDKDKRKPGTETGTEYGEEKKRNIPSEQEHEKRNPTMPEDR
jgi:hypothetical protein